MKFGKNVLINNLPRVCIKLPCTFDDDLSIRFSSSDWSMSSGETTVIFTSATVFGSVEAVPYVPTNLSMELPSIDGSGTSILSSSG